jgi:hypothetical protein
MARTMPRIEIEGHPLSVAQVAILRVVAHRYLRDRFEEVSTGRVSVESFWDGIAEEAVDLLQRLIAPSNEAVHEKKLIADCRRILDGQQ